MKWCCGDDAPSPAPEYRPGETYRFTPNVGRRVFENAGIALAASVLLTMFLYMPGGTFRLPLGQAISVSAGLAVLVLLMTTLPLVGPSVAREIEVSPQGIVIARRDGSRDVLAWSKIKGYVHEGDRYTFLLQNGQTVLLITLGLTTSEKALLRTAIRTPLSPGSLKWRGREETASRPGAMRTPLFVVLCCVILGGALTMTDHREAAGALLVFGALYLAYVFYRHRRGGR